MWSMSERKVDPMMKFPPAREVVLVIIPRLVPALSSPQLQEFEMAVPMP